MDSRLDNMLLSHPCPIDWDSMKGHEYTRFCSQCSSNVYNISSLTREEAETFLDENESACIKFYVREDGTVKSKNCFSFLEKSRTSYAWLKRTVSLACSFLVSFLPGGAKLAFGLESEDCIKQKWEGNARKFDYHGLKGLLGRQARSDVRVLIESLLPINLSPNSKTPETLQEITGDIEKTRTIKADHVQKLKQYFLMKGDKYSYFLACKLETLLNVENPALDQNAKKRSVAKFEKLRLAEMDRLLEDAKSIQVDEDDKGIRRNLEKFFALATEKPELLQMNRDFPCYLENWKYPNFTTMERRKPVFRSLSATESQIDRAISILDAIKNGATSKEQDRMVRILKLAKIYKLKDDNKPYSIQEFEAIEKELSLIDLMLWCRSLYLGKYEKYEIDGISHGVNRFSFARIFRPAKKLAGREVNGTFYEYPTVHLKDRTNRNDPYNLPQFKTLIPKAGTEFLLLGQVKSNNGRSVEACAVFPATKEMIDLAVKHYRQM